MAGHLFLLFVLIDPTVYGTTSIRRTTRSRYSSTLPRRCETALTILSVSKIAHRHGVAYNRRQNLFVSVHESSIHVYEAVERRASAYARLKHHKRFDRPVWMATTPLLEAPSVGATPYAAFCSADQLSLWRVDTANLLPPEVNVGIPISEFSVTVMRMNVNRIRERCQENCHVSGSSPQLCGRLDGERKSRASPLFKSS